VLPEVPPEVLPEVPAEAVPEPSVAPRPVVAVTGVLWLVVAEPAAIIKHAFISESSRKSVGKPNFW
jgi:hypothetical protein